MRKSKALIVRQLLEQGKTPKEAAALAGVTVQYVYSVRHADKKRSATKVKRKYTKKKRIGLESMSGLDAAPIYFDATQNPPIPAPKLTLRQRFVVLFTGRV